MCNKFNLLAEYRENKTNTIFYTITFVISFAIIVALIFTFEYLNEPPSVTAYEKPLSSIQSNIKVQPTTVSLKLPENSFIYGEQGGTVTGDSQMSFDAGSDELSFKVSYPSKNKRKSFDMKLSGEKSNTTYQIKNETKRENVYYICLKVSGLNTSLKWFLNEKEVTPSPNGTLEITLQRQISAENSIDTINTMLYSEFLLPKIALIGYSPKDNSIQDGIILKYIP